MLKINPAPTFEFDAQLTVPGAAELATVRITARYKKRDDIKAWIAGAKEAGNDCAFLGPVIVGWVGVHGKLGEEVPYSPEALAELFNAYPCSSQELYDQYLAALLESRRKN